MKEKTYGIIGYIILGIGTLLSSYMYFWSMCLKQIILAIQAFMDGTFTWMTAVSLLAHIFLGWIPAVIVSGIAFLIAVTMMYIGEEYGK